MEIERSSNKRLKYIVSYDCLENAKENRVNILASSNKIDYIVKKVNEAGFSVDLISTSQTLNKQFYNGKIIKKGENTLRLFPTMPRGGVVFRIINVVVMRSALIFYLIRNVKKNEVIMIYHSIGNMWMINFLKKLKQARIIEEVEEIYGDIYGKQGLARKERKLLRNVDAYIYPTILLNQEVNYYAKPYVIIHGAYSIKEMKVIAKLHEEDNRFHIAYTGILDPKKGCLDFVKAARYLDNGFYLHVLGFGSDEELDLLNATVEEVVSKTECKVSYDGVRRGEEYEEYLQKLDGGICPLDSGDPFTKTQFPSKVISYLSNGLDVICSDVEAVRTSDVGEKVLFYEGNGSECIAKAIVNLNKKTSNEEQQATIRDCDLKFGFEIKKLLYEVEKNEIR